MKTKFILSAMLLCLIISQNAISQIEQTPTAYMESIQSIRTAKDQAMLNTETSPLPTDQMDKFTGLSYFPVDVNFKINASYTPEAEPKEVSLNTTNGGKLNLMKYGNVTFDYDGKTYSLAVFQNKDLPEFGANKNQLFIPFTDLTSGKETYGGGRYLTVELPTEGNTMVIDFNMAMNPYSAYNNTFASVVPPEENSMFFSVQTGERKYEDR